MSLVESARAERLRAVVKVCVVLDDELELALAIVSEDTAHRTGARRYVHVTADRRHDLLIYRHVVRGETLFQSRETASLTFLCHWVKEAGRTN